MRKGDLALGHGEEEGRPRLGHWRGCLAYRSRGVWPELCRRLAWTQR